MLIDEAAHAGAAGSYFRQITALHCRHEITCCTLQWAPGLSESPLGFAVCYHQSLCGLVAELRVVDCVVYCVFVLTNGPVLCKKRGEITPSSCRPHC